jgi:hypothetical protein
MGDKYKLPASDSVVARVTSASVTISAATVPRRNPTTWRHAATCPPAFVPNNFSYDVSKWGREWIRV